jgi:hypothetical protein
LKKKQKKAISKKERKLAKKRRRAREKAFTVSDQSLAEMRALVRLRPRRRREATKTWKEVLSPAVPPPGVLPKDSPVMAMDENVSAFAGWAGNYFPSAVAEGQAFLGYPYLSELLLRAEYRRMAEVVSTQMTRKWIKLTSTKEAKGDRPDDARKDKLKKIESEMKRLGIRQAFERAALFEEGMGRSHIVLDFGDMKKPNELTTDVGDGRDTTSRGKVTTKKPLRRVKNVEPVWAYPSNYNATDPMDPAWYRPEEWYVMAKRIHASRLLTFIGREVPDMLKPAYSFGGLSLTQMAKPYVDNWLRTRQSVSDIINAFSVMVLSTTMGNTQLPGGNVNLLNRLDLFNVLRDNANIMAINKDTEDFKNVSAPLGTLDHLQAQTQEHMAAVSGIPLIFLLGIQPTGLNASSEGEIRVFYDWVNSYQELLFRPNQLSLFGEVDDEIDFEFEPLWSMNEKEKADLKKLEAETDTIDINAGVLDPQERRQRIISDPESPYSNLNPDDVPDLLEEEEEGLEPKGSAEKTTGLGDRMAA